MAKPEIVGSIEPKAVPFPKILRRHLAVLQERFNTQVNEAIGEAFEDAKLDDAVDWKTDFVKNAWVSTPKPS